MPDNSDIPQTSGKREPTGQSGLVFIVACSRDYGLAGKVYDFLTAHGISAFFSERTLQERGHSNFRREIDRALEEAAHMVVVASQPDNLCSEWVESEWGVFVGELRSRRKSGNLVTVVGEPVQPADLPIGLRGYEAVTFGPEGLEKLLHYVSLAPPVGGVPALSGRPKVLPWVAAAVLVSALGVYLVLSYLHSSGQPRGDRLPPSSPPSTSASDSVWPKCHALAIGINQYESAQNKDWKNLKTARADAEAVATVLEDRYGFQVTRLLDREATRSAIIARLDELTAQTDSDATLIYFAGHGLYDEALREGYWIPCDAQRTRSGRDTKEDWIWNTTITKILGASRARHVLVIADACYAGSLSVGAGEMKSGARTPAWYEEAVSKPSRFLISSAGLESATDGNLDHSEFARQVLRCLDQPVEMVSASEIGLRIREALQPGGQMVQWGPMNMPEHSGGEFVFIRKDALLSRVSNRAGGYHPASQTAAVTEPDATALMQQAILLGSQGATNAAQKLLALSAQSKSFDRGLAQAVTSYLDAERRAKSRTELRRLVASIDAQAKASARGGQPGTNSGEAKPRIIACLGPNAYSANAETEGRALLLRAALRSELERTESCQVVEREALEQILQEMRLAGSSLSDPRSQELLGKLMPASLLLVGDLLPESQEQYQLLLRLVDTETTRILHSYQVLLKPGENLAVTCTGLASNIAACAIARKPLVARVVSLEGDRLTALVGSWHGAHSGQSYLLVEMLILRTNPEPQERTLGRTTLTRLGKDKSEFQVENGVKIGSAARGTLWVREQPPSVGQGL